MSRVRTVLHARHDASEDRTSMHERTRNVQLALQSLTPCFSRQQRHKSHRLSRLSSAPSFSSSPTPTKAYQVPEPGKKRRSPPPTLNIQHPARLIDPKDSSLSATAIPAAQYLHTPSTIIVELPLSPLTPAPPHSPATIKRRRFSRLCRRFGESLPPELVFGVDCMPLEPGKGCGCLQKDAFASIAPAMNKGKAPCVLHIFNPDQGRGDLQGPPVLLVKNTEGLRHIAQQNVTTWTLERNGRRIKQHSYDEVLNHLRKL